MAPTVSAASDLDQLLSDLAASREASLAFTETRHSDLLDEPIEVSGTLHHGGDGRLVRNTTSPRETTQTLTENHVEIRRPDGYRQRFSLDRAPELRVLRQALLALLDGDRTALESHFELAFEASDAAENAGWTLRLIPVGEAQAEEVVDLELRGEDARLVSLAVHLSDGEALSMRFEQVP